MSHYIDRRCFENRELSWLSFNERVLDEADYAPWPLLERLRFVHIFTNNLDEFTMIRVGSLYDRYLVGGVRADGKTGMTVEQQLSAIFTRTRGLLQKRDDVFAKVRGLLSRAAVEHLRPCDLNAEELAALQKQFDKHIRPLLTWQVIDAAHPVPHLGSKQLAIAVQLEARPGEGSMAVVWRTEKCKRVIPVTCTEDVLRFVLLEDVVLHFVDQLFRDRAVRDRCVFCVTRNADLSVQEELCEEDVNYREYMAKLLERRKKLSPVRLECGGRGEDGAPGVLLGYFLRDTFRLPATASFATTAPLRLDYFSELEGLLSPEHRKQLCFEGIRPVYPLCLAKGHSVMQQVRRRDVLINVPYERYTPFLTLIREAASDPNVESIQLTVYRLGNDSTLIEQLIDAALLGKEVVVMVELRARFDERRNIAWAVRLEEAGVRVLYGLGGFKVHGKLCLITRRHRKQLQYITEVGTGNYNEETVRQYADLILITADQTIGKDAAAIFQRLKAGKAPLRCEALSVSPVSFKSDFMRLVDGEIAKARRGKPAMVRVKCNGVTDRDIIAKLVDASRAGVQVHMIVRGILCLRPGLQGLTENIQAISIVGRFLEHARMYSFGVGKDRATYISSADLMTRNTERRVELACPIQDPELEQRVSDLFAMQWRDNVKAREQLPNATYRVRTPKPGEAALDSQLELARILREQRTALDEAGVPKLPARRILRKRIAQRLEK